MLPKQTPSIAIIILLNLLPVFGVWQWGWTPFEVFYLFWIETLIIAVFNALKIIFCRGDEYEEKLEKSNPKFGSIHVQYSSHIKKAIYYFLARLFIFFFYLIFIIAFIGMVISEKGKGLGILETLFFFNKTFNLAVLGFILNQAALFIFNFILGDEYKRTHPSDFAAIFDGRQIIVHVAVVIGGVFGGIFGGFFGNTSNANKIDNPIITYIFVTSILCIAKIIFEVMKYKGLNIKMEARK